MGPSEKSNHVTKKQTVDPVMSLPVWNGPRFLAEKLMCSYSGEAGKWAASYKPVLDSQGRFLRYTDQRVRILCPKGMK